MSEREKLRTRVRERAEGVRRFTRGGENKTVCERETEKRDLE